MGASIVPILGMRKWSPRKREQLVQGHIPSKGQSQHWNPVHTVLVGKLTRAWGSCEHAQVSPFLPFFLPVSRSQLPTGNTFCVWDPFM